MLSLLDSEKDARYHNLLLETQRLAWTQLQDESLAALKIEWKDLLQGEHWSPAWRSRDVQKLGEVLRAVGSREHWSAVVFDARRNMVYSTTKSMRQSSMASSVWIRRALESEEFVSGFNRIAKDSYAFVVARRFGPGDDRGVLVIGLDVAHLLAGLHRSMGGQSHLLNLRGTLVSHTDDASLKTLSITKPGDDGVKRIGEEGRWSLVITQALYGFGGRRVGGLLSLRDITTEYEADRHLVIVSACCAMASVLLLGAVTFFYLKKMFRPLERSVSVLRDLSNRNLHTGSDGSDLLLNDEAGGIARGVESLREELLNLQMLRDERMRSRQQQERLIRRELKMLAESLDDDSRQEMLDALEPRSGSRGSENELAELARILGRLSGLISGQQSRLVSVLQELRTAMQHQATLISLKQELEIARTMQLSILPRAAPCTPHAQVEARILPAKEVGGDFYDYFLVDDNRLAIAIADVSGKGVPSAFFMAISRTLLKASARFNAEPSEVVKSLNEQLCVENEQMMFVTLFFAILHLDSGVLEYVNAGHNPPLLKLSSGKVLLLPKGQNVALAVVSGVAFKQGDILLGRGDTLLLYTDGVTEATSAAGNLFGEAALLDLTRGHGVGPGLADSVVSAVQEFETGVPQADDITCVSLRYRGLT